MAKNNTATLRRLGAMLGRKVRTPDGVGFLLSIDTPSNGLYFEATRTTCVVWYGTGNRHSNGKVSWVYAASDIKADR